MTSEWSLILFTVFAQASTGLMIFVALHQLLKGDITKLSVKPALLFLVCAVVMGLGFGLATLHLGSPQRMLNSMSKLGTSALSLEGLVGMITMAVCALTGLLGLKSRINTALAGLSLILGLAFVYCMGQVYASMLTVPTWSTWLTHASFFGASFLTGGTAFLFFNKASDPPRQMAVGGVVVGAILLIVSIPMQVQLAQSYFTTMDGISTLGSWATGLTALALAIAALGVFKTRMRLPACLMGLAAVFVARAMFYGLHITIGLQ